MSADNFVVVKKHPKGGYTHVMGFASDDYPSGQDGPPATVKSPVFETVGQAYRDAEETYDIIEYGISIAAECGDKW